MAFVATNKAPGVYIEEVQVPGPIPGVGTSTAAFIGPARRGPLNTPTFVTNWTQFVEAFGVQDKNGPYISAPMVYAAHAVRGFFDNGGAMCYFVRVGTAVRASLGLNDRGAPAQRTLVVTAKSEGVSSNAVTVEVLDAHIASMTAVNQQGTLTGASTNNTVTVSNADAAKFRPGDIVFLEGAASERAIVSRISGGTITFESNLTNVYAAADTIRIADLAPGQKTIRVDATTGVEPGSYITLTQGATTESGVVQAVERVNNFLSLTAGLANTYSMAGGAAAVTIETQEFSLRFVTPGSGTENFNNLSMDPRHSRYFASIVASTSVDVSLADPATSNAPPNNRPAVIAATNLTGGLDDDITQINSTHYHTAIDALEKVDDVNILCVPDRTDQDVQAYMIAHCEKMQDRFAVIDPQYNATPTGIVTQRNLYTSDNGYAALYYPWISISNPLAAGRLKVPPSGHIAGLYARTDNNRGVHKAPANDTLKGVLALERTLTDDEQGPLNEQGINVIRSFPGRGIRVWGARTISTSTQWRYVNVRRLLLFIEESIQEGTQFAVFEPNDPGLWKTVKRQVDDFLTRVWKDGALFGATPDDAFRVRIDEELNPPSIRALGQLIVEVIVYPTTPAEFVVFRVIQQPGGPLIEE